MQKVIKDKLQKIKKLCNEINKKTCREWKKDNINSEKKQKRTLDVLITLEYCMIEAIY